STTASCHFVLLSSLALLSIHRSWAGLEFSTMTTIQRKFGGSSTTGSYALD
ncbi:unnamed protein product, partial [Musa acuminata subsp. burmannicoides]